MGAGSAAYDTVRVLHLLAVIVGFGGVLLNGAYGARAKALRGREGQAVFEANLHVTETFAHKFIFAVPVFGIAMVLMEEGWDFDQPWIWGALLAYSVALTISLGPMGAAAKRMHLLMAEVNAIGPPPPGGSAAGGPPPQVAEMEAIGRRWAPWAGSWACCSSFRWS